jgi:transposase
MEWMPLLHHFGLATDGSEERDMDDVAIIGIDLAKQVFHAHGARSDGSVAFRKRLSRAQVLPFLEKQSRCVVAMEAVASAHQWGRAIIDLGHQVRLIPPTYVKPFVKRQKNDTADAEAIAEACARPTMRFVAVKSEEQQARAMVFRTRDLLVRQRTQLINALRGHLAEHGVVAPQGPANLKVLASVLDDADRALPSLVRDLGLLFLDQIILLDSKIADIKKTLRREAQRGHETRRLQTMPGIAPITAMAVEAFAPPMSTFKRGRDFAAWLGLVPIQHSTGGKQRLGRTSKMGQRDIRRLLIIGAMSVIRWASRRGARKGSWLQLMMDRKPLMLVAMALANKMARTIWAMLTKQEDYRDPAVAVA